MKAISIFITLFFIFGNSTIKAQKTNYIISLTPTKANFNHGLSLGLWNMPSPPLNQTFNGINVELIGMGWITPFLGLDNEQIMHKNVQKINGLSFGLTLLNDKVNGVALSPLIATTTNCNGIQFSLINNSIGVANGIQLGLTNFGIKHNGITIGFYNWTYESNGIQIGIINKSKDLNGFQFGLININQKRITPILNWSFKN